VVEITENGKGSNKMHGKMVLDKKNENGKDEIKSFHYSKQSGQILSKIESSTNILLPKIQIDDKIL
jgi:hypothetical protein